MTPEQTKLFDAVLRSLVRAIVRLDRLDLSEENHARAIRRLTARVSALEQALEVKAPRPHKGIRQDHDTPKP